MPLICICAPILRRPVQHSGTPTKSNAEPLPLRQPAVDTPQRNTRLTEVTLHSSCRDIWGQCSLTLELHKGNSDCLFGETLLNFMSECCLLLIFFILSSCPFLYNFLLPQVGESPSSSDDFFFRVYNEKEKRKKKSTCNLIISSNNNTVFYELKIFQNGRS